MTKNLKIKLGHEKINRGVLEFLLQMSERDGNSQHTEGKIDPTEEVSQEIAKTDQENAELVEKIMQLEGETEILRSKINVATKKISESGSTSSFLIFVVLLIITFYILLKK